MMKIVLLVKQSTVRVLEEHTVSNITSVMSLNDAEALIMLEADVMEELIRRRRPEDERIDEVILRVAL